MSDPKKEWSEFYRKNKVAILVGAAIVVALSMASGGGGDGGGGGGGGGGTDQPVVVLGPDGGGGSEVAAPVSLDDWKKDQDRQEVRHKEFVESVIREEQTCSNGKVISIHETCPDE